MGRLSNEAVGAELIAELQSIIQNLSGPITIEAVSAALKRYYPSLRIQQEIPSRVKKNQKFEFGTYIGAFVTSSPIVFYYERKPSLGDMANR